MVKRNTDAKTVGANKLKRIIGRTSKKEVIKISVSEKGSGIVAVVFCTTNESYYCEMMARNKPRALLMLGLPPNPD